MSKRTVLVVSSVADELKLKDGKVAKIGVYLNELVVPAMAVVDAGFEIVLATPTGGRPVIDAHSRNAAHFGDDKQAFDRALTFFNEFPAMAHPVTIRSAIDGGLDKFSAVFVPGGHAPIVDLSQDADVGDILRYFHDKGRPTALLCHGPIALIASVPDMRGFRAAMESGDTAKARSAAKNWIYAGYQMTIFSDQEEQVAEEQLLNGKMTFYVGDALAAAGGIVTSNTHPFDPHVTHDRELITGQNPRSDHALANELVKALES